jgi:hypothetical protein
MTPAIGQVWRDMDKRIQAQYPVGSGRFLQILRFGTGSWAEHVFCAQVIPTGESWHRIRWRRISGKEYRIACSRLRPGSNGYECADSTAAPKD